YVIFIPRYSIFSFSSRRRHTRSTRDWSSDVCSSDLLLASITFATVMTFIARKHAFTKTLERMTGSAGLQSIGTGFTLLASRMGIQGVSLREATLGSAFSINLNGHGVVAVSPELVASLTPDEAEAVVAHEL